MSIRIAYNSDYKSTELRKSYDHWLQIELKADAHNVTVSVNNPVEPAQFNKKLPLKRLPISKDEAFKIVSDNLEELLGQYPQSQPDIWP